MTILVTPGVVVHLKITALSIISDSGTGTTKICSPVMVNGGDTIHFDSAVLPTAFAFILAKYFCLIAISASVTIIKVVSTTFVKAGAVWKVESLEISTVYWTT